MKNTQWAVNMAAVIAFCSLIGIAAAKDGNGNGNGNGNGDRDGDVSAIEPIVPAGIPPVPMAVFSATPSVVQAGTFPTLNWSITYPSKMSDVVSVTAPGTITVNSSMYVSVRPVGVGVTQSGRGADIDTISAEARMSVNGSAYHQLFYGNNAQVDPTYSLYIKELPAGTTINFGGRYVNGEAWTPFYTSQSANMQVITLTNGDTIPSSVNLAESGALASYLKPYVNSAGQVNIGPLSALVLMELAETDHGNSRFDYQDMALLVTFSQNHPNNGHGNNIDGLDPSNPGGGKGGPDGVNPSGGVDDESR